MFDSLSEKLQQTLAGVRNRGTLSEQDIDAALREIRLALLEADVNFKIARSFTAGLRERCLGAEVVGGVNPAQQVAAIVAEELAALMGGASAQLSFAPRPPTVVLMAGLQGSGKTTACAKLARQLREERSASVALAACDVYRPAAVEQLVKLGAQAQAKVYEQGTGEDPVAIASWALARAREDGADVLLVLDAMTGQEAASVAESFAEAVAFDGVVLTKLDGDARGGAALSVGAVSGRPIMYASTGETLGQFEAFHPQRMAQRILGMGDVMGLMERAERQFQQDEAQELERKLRRNEFGLDDFLGQLKALRRMGPLTGLLGMIPGVGAAQLRGMKVDERELDRIEAIILSMTPGERRRPELIKGARRLRIARGSGTSVQEVSRLVKQFAQMRTMLRQVGRGKVPDMAALMRAAR